ncbi:MAG: EAL domain-containing protein [Egibacteraceae bacterium]
MPDGAWLSVNVSPSFLLQGEHLVRAMRSTPRPLVLELTEHDPIDDYPAIRAAVDRLGSAVQLSIDDAGTGYACLNHVLSLRPDFVKLDRSWVRDIDTDPARQALVAGLEHFTSRTGSTLIAEGVETDAELTVLSDLRVPLAQGYLLGRPVPISHQPAIPPPY